MVVAAHTVHNSGTEQRFYTGQKRYGQTARQNLQHQIDVKAGQLRFGQKMRHTAKLVSDGVNIQSKQRKDNNQQRRSDNTDQKCRQVGLFDFDVKDGGKRKDRNKQRGSAKFAEIFQIHFPLGQKFGRHVFYLKAEQILNLGGNKQNADTGRKTDNHRIRNVLNICSQPQKTGHNQNHAGNQHRHCQTVIAIILHYVEDNDDESSGRTANLIAAAAKQRNKETGHNCGIQPLSRADAGSDRQRHRQGNGYDGDRHSRNGIAAKFVYRIRGCS